MIQSRIGHGLNGVIITIIRNSSNDNGDGNKNVALKYNFISFVLLRDFFISSFNSYKNDELPRDQIGRLGVRAKKDNEKFTVKYSCSPQKLALWSFQVVVLSRTRRNVSKFKTHVHSGCFFFIN